MKPRPPRKKERFDLPSAAYKALKQSEKSLSLKELYSLLQQSANDIKNDLSLSALHTELNVDGRFIYLNDRTWTLKTKVPTSARKDFDDFDLLEVEYQPAKDDYKWEKNAEDTADDESELLVPYDGEEIDINAEDDSSPITDEDEETDEDEDEYDDEYPEKE